tara:strand:+ start:541 stop:720 length:180 start_codon:yes stop_codon:yes gene_type:complete
VIPVNTRPKLLSGSPRSFDGPNIASATVEMKKQFTNYSFLGNALKMIGQRIADESNANA